MPATKKKSTRKQQHARAIEGFEKWLKKHPKATPERKVQQFDIYVDSSELEEILR